MRIVPVDKHDLEACENLELATNEEISPFVKELLECLQDLNWPIAMPVSISLSKLGAELVDPIKSILQGSDEVWKYWIVSDFLHRVCLEVILGVQEDLIRIKTSPTKTELSEEVFEVVVELLRDRLNA